ncbi:MAG: hypothetical protein JF615_06685, partial [Asticcacaulis sp.]|nr:hypothetical protein [Asticcacaulis sp.]
MSLHRRFLLTAAGAAVLSPSLGFAAAKTSPAASGTYLTRPWTGPYGGVPPFDKVKIADFEP